MPRRLAAAAILAAACNTVVTPPGAAGDTSSGGGPTSSSATAGGTGGTAGSGAGGGTAGSGTGGDAGSPDPVDLPTFCAMAREMLDLGAYTGFHEREVSRRVDDLGGVVHVLSAYETKRHPAAIDRLGQGVNSIQLVREGDGWRVVSLCWDEEALRGPTIDLGAIVGGEVARG